MIVRKLDDGSMILINQTDHAKLSGFFAAHWGNADFATPSRRESTIRAAALHDCGWYRYETEPRYDPQTKTSPTFFQVPNDEAQLAAFGGGIDWLTSIDAYSGLLISRHRTGLWRGRYGAVTTPTSISRAITDPGVEMFAAGYERQQEAAFTQLDRDEFNINYRLLQFWDLFSLALCAGEPKDQVFDPVPAAYDGEGGKGLPVRMTPAGAEIRLDPYPFDRKPLPLACSYRHLPTSDYASEADFRLAYFGCAPKMKTFVFV
jgi:hypothetical protein